MGDGSSVWFVETHPHPRITSGAGSNPPLEGEGAMQLQRGIVQSMICTHVHTQGRFETMLRVLIAFAFIASALFAAAAEAAPAKAAIAPHPIVGKWEWTRSENACKEVYDFRADGTAHIVSGEEVTDNTYTIDHTPRDHFYRLKLKVTKDHGGKDCGDHDEDGTGQESTVYIFINAEKTMHVVCTAAAFDTCFGPLKRVP